MAKYNEFRLEGCVNVPDGVTEDEFFDTFIELIESKDWIYGGAIIALDDNGDDVLEQKAGYSPDMKTRVFTTVSPDDTFVTVDCGSCGGRLKTDRFSKQLWNEYMQHHYKPELPKFCPNCGKKVAKTIKTAELEV